MSATDSGRTLSDLGEAAYLAHDYDTAIELAERAYAAYRDDNDDLGAVRMARLLAFLHATVRGDGAVMAGWNARAQTLLRGTESGPEHGWVALQKGMFEPNRAAKDRLLREAVEIGRAFGDTDLEFEALAYLGASMVHGDRIAEGMNLLDEALAAVAGGEVQSYFGIQNIFCQLFSACEYAHDVDRADQWIRIGDEIASRRNLPAVSAYCRTHYGALLTAAGRFTEADEALTDAVRVWGGGHVGLRWMALVRLADLRVRQGRIEEAEQLLEGLDVYYEAAGPLAAVYRARGNLVLAAEILERALAQMEPGSSAAGPLLTALVEIGLECGALAGATEAAERLDALAAQHGGHYLPAAAALARGRLCLATDSGDPAACLRDALTLFSRAQLPLDTACARMELARALASGQPEVAVAEAKAAFTAFERLEAAREADEAAAFLRSLGSPVRVGPKGREALTKREAEVLDLLGHGLSNPEISDRLFISRKTVEHHVGRILAKLGLRSRAEAAAYAARAEKISP